MYLETVDTPMDTAPFLVFRWYEFLEFYVAERVPEMNPLVRSLGGSEFGNFFGMEGYQFPDDRFEDIDYAYALDLYEAEPTVHVLFEIEEAGTDQPGAPIPRYEIIPTILVTNRHRNHQMMARISNGELTENPMTTGIDTWTFDPDSGDDTFFGPSGYELLVPLWDIQNGIILRWEPLPLSNRTIFCRQNDYRSRSIGSICQ